MRVPHKFFSKTMYKLIDQEFEDGWMEGNMWSSCWHVALSAALLIIYGEFAMVVHSFGDREIHKDV